MLRIGQGRRYTETIYADEFYSLNLSSIAGKVLHMLGTSCNQFASSLRSTLALCGFAQLELTFTQECCSQFSQPVTVSDLELGKTRLKRMKLFGHEIYVGDGTEYQKRCCII